MARDNSTISEFRRRTAKQLRDKVTGAEDLLWRRLRRFPISGTHFRRQVPIGPYVADFACMAARLIIEVDGSHHGEGDTKKRDGERSQWIEADGYRVIRFWNNEVTQTAAGVLDVFYAALYGSRKSEPAPLKHARRRDHPTPARSARRPSPSRG